MNTVQIDIDSKRTEAVKYHQSGQLQKAEEIYKKILAINPNHSDALHLLGVIAHQVGKNDIAVNLIINAIENNPKRPDYYNNLGMVFRDQGRLDEAISCCEKALQLKPDYAAGHLNLGNAFRDQGMLDEAISCYEKALQLRPDLAEALNNMGIVFRDQGRLDEAISCCEKALQLKPGYAEAHNNMGNTFRDQGKLDEAISCYEKALQLESDPGIEVKTSLVLPVICESKESIERSRKKLIEQIESLQNKDLTLTDPHKQVGIANFYLAYHGLNDKEIQRKIASFYIHVCPDLAWTAFDPNKERPLLEKINIGIISRFLYNHTIGKLNYGIIRNLCRERFHVKLFRFPRKEDHLSKAINSAADEVVILPTELTIARQNIAKHSLDILFYPDIGMDPLTYFLAFSRLAPVQCVTFGHPVTTGIPNMDYFISSDNAEPPGAEDHYSEHLVLLKRLPIYYYHSEPPKEPGSREKFGLPYNCNLYVCPQSLFKFHPDFDEVLGAILRRDPRGLLVLIEGQHGHWTKLLRDRLSRTLPDVKDRVRFLPGMRRKDFLSLLKVADVLLDTPYFGGGNTSLESFGVGTPIVTWPGQFMRDRLTLALYKQMGVMDCVADSAQSYVDIALGLANDKAWGQEIKDKIKAGADVLYEDLEAVRELEQFFEWAVVQPRKMKFAS